MTFVFRISNGAAQSVWGNSILALWIFVVEGSNSDATVKVGLASSFQGMATVLVGWFAGWAADKFRRDRIIRLGGVTGFFAIATTVSAVLSGPCNLVEYRFALTCTACALWGVFQGVTNASVEALFGDSVPTGERSEVYMWRDSLTFLATALGPGVAVIIFQALGNTWHIDELNAVMLAGLSLAVIPCVSCFLFKDECALGAASDAVTERRASTEGKAGSKEEPQDTVCGRDCASSTSVPAIQFSSSLIMGIASGMTSKYWPVFFKARVGVSPTVVMAMFVACPILQSILSVAAQILSRRLGRVQVVVLCVALAIPIQFLIAIDPRFHSFEPWTNSTTAHNATNQSAPATLRPSEAIEGRMWSYPVIVLAAWLLRTALMNCFSPISKSILNDFAPRATRGRWNSLSSIQVR